MPKYILTFLLGYKLYQLPTNAVVLKDDLLDVMCIYFTNDIKHTKVTNLEGEGPF